MLMNLWQKDNRCTTRKEKRRWTPLLLDVLKINTDGAFNADEKNGAWGFVIRDNNGQRVLAASGRLSAVHNALVAEGEACLVALYAAMYIGISRIIVDTDSSNLAMALRSNSYDQSPGGVIYQEAHDLLEHFNLVDVCVVSCSCNVCVHELAHSSFARDLDVPIIWNDPLPSFVIDLVGRDLSVSPVE
jgi:ribonuclease HI